MPTDDQVVLAASTLVPPAIAVLMALWPVTRRRLAAFATTYRVHVTGDNAPLLIAHLARTRRYRSIGAAVGWGIGSFDTVVGLPFGVYGGAFAGYFLGALLAEARSAGTLPPGPRQASLAPRRVAEYVSPTARWLPSILGLVAAVALIIPLRWPQPPDQVQLVPPIAVAVTAVALAVVIVWARDWIVARPQRLGAADLVAADDGLRASSIQTLSGAGAALLCLMIGALLAGVDRSAVPAPVHTFLTGSDVALLVLLLISWRGLPHWGRPVRTSTPSAA